MKNSGTFSVLFQPRFEKESKGKTLLYIRINANNKRTRFSLKRKFTTALWDPISCRLKGSSIEAQQINPFLDQVFLGVHEAYGQLVKEKKRITPHSVMSRYKGEDEINKTLIQLSTYHNFNMKSVLKPGTLKNYFSTEKYLKRFLQIERKTDDIYLENLNTPCMDRV